MILRNDWSAAIGAEKLLDTLLHDPRGLTHLCHADHLAIVIVAMLSDRNVKFHFLVAFVRLRPAKIPRGAGAAHHHAGEAPGPALVQSHDADARVALLEDAALDEQFIEIVADLQKRLAPCADIFDKLRRTIPVHAAGPKIIRVHARARRPLIKD